MRELPDKMLLRKRWEEAVYTPFYDQAFENCNVKNHTCKVNYKYSCEDKHVTVNIEIHFSEISRYTHTCICMHSKS